MMSLFKHVPNIKEENCCLICVIFEVSFFKLTKLHSFENFLPQNNHIFIKEAETIQYLSEGDCETKMYFTYEVVLHFFYFVKIISRA